MKTAHISQKLNADMRVLIVRVISEILNDPDFGRELSAKAKKRLQSVSVSRAKSIPFSEIRRKYF